MVVGSLPETRWWCCDDRHDERHDERGPLWGASVTAPMDEAVLVEHLATGVRRLTLNRPDSMNALTSELCDQLAAALATADSDPTVGAVVITGNGRGFCAGGNVNVMAAGARDAAPQEPLPGAEFDAYEASVRSIEVLADSIVGRIYRHSKPTVAVINGTVAGAGIGIAGACDIRIAASSASFTTSYARIGRSGDFGGTFFYRQLLGPAKSRELFFTSKRVDAAEALVLGLVSYVYPDGEALAQGLGLAAEIAAGPVSAFGRMKEVFRAADAGNLSEVLSLEAKYQALTGRTSEGRAAMTAFMAARQARKRA